ncbi:MAG: phosphotransferase [Anaerolineae bacterium]|nr:phosphotransferase [Anaerolineae bacterium]
MQNHAEQANIIDQECLTAAVRAAIGRPDAVLQEWHAQILTTGFDLHHTIYRCSGEAIDQQQVYAWTLIIKVIQPAEGRLSPRCAVYWKREYLAYRSGFLAHLPRGLAAPVCYLSGEANDGSVWLVLEDLADDSGHTWQANEFTRAAFQLGVFNGAFLSNDLPDIDWLPDRWLFSYLDQAAETIPFLYRNRRHPLVRTLFGWRLPVVLALWDLRHDLLKLLERHPQVFCHNDAFLHNLFFRDGSLNAIDWSYTGPAPLGAELAAFIPVSLTLSDFSLREMRKLDRLCVQSYMDGVKQSGFSTRQQDIRQVYVITFLLRYLVAALVGEIFPYLLTLYNDGDFPEMPPDARRGRNGRFYGEKLLEGLWFMGLRNGFSLLLRSIRHALTAYGFDGKEV